MAAFERFPGSDSVDDDPLVGGRIPPSNKEVTFQHSNASTQRPEDIHHRIGFNDADAASGSHTHNGVDSKPLFANATIANLPPTASTAQIITTINEILAVLRTKGLG